MTIVNCNFFDNPGEGGKLVVQRWGVSFDGDLSNPASITKPLVNGQASVTLFPATYLFSAFSAEGRVFWSQRVTVPRSVSPVDLWDIAGEVLVPPSELDQSIGAIASRIAEDPLFAGLVADEITVVGAQEDRKSFTQSDLSVTGTYTILHNFGKAPRSVRLKDSNGYEICPDDIQDNGTTTTVIFLTSLQPLTGTWTVILGA